jgi:hypothetical protein
MPFVVPALAAIGGGSAIAGGIGLASGVAGILGSRAQASATRNATQSQNQAAQAQLDLQREQFGINRTNLNQFITPGVAAQGAQTALLGLGGDAAAQNAAFDRFRDSTDYQFRFGEGQRSLNSGFGAGNSRLTGRRAMALNDYGQNMASGAFNDYYNRISGIGDRGFAAASALGGVSQNFANSSGQIIQNQADNRSNAALVNGQNSANMWGGLASALGGLAGRTSFG